MAMELSCEDFGLTKEEMLDRLITKMAESFLGMDMENEGPSEDSRFSKTTVLKHIQNMIKEQVEKSVSAIADEHVLPRVDEIITGMVIQTTNQFGEKKGSSKTLTEFVVETAENYLSEEVDSQGKNRKQATQYGSTFKPAQNRLMHAVNSHIKDKLNTALTNATKDVHKTFSDGVALAVDKMLKDMRVSFMATVKS